MSAATRSATELAFYLTLVCAGACSYPDYGFSNGAGAGGQAGSAGVAGSAGEAGASGAGGTSASDAGDASDAVVDGKGDAGPSCKPADTLTLGKAVTGSNDPLAGGSNVSNAINDYTCATKVCDGFEATWRFEPTTVATYRFTVTNLDADCDLYIVGPALCAGACAGPNASSTQKVGTTESVDVSLLAGAEYFVSVDAGAGLLCSFQLAVIQL